MRKVEAIIRPGQLTEVRDGLTKCGIRGMTVSDVLGCGREKGTVGVFRGSEYKITLLPKVRIEVVVAAAMVEDVIDIIIKHARTGAVGDGKIFVTAVEQAYRIRTGDSGKAAL